MLLAQCGTPKHGELLRGLLDDPQKGVEFGLGGGLFYVTYVLFEIPSNLAMKKIGPRLWIARIMLSWGLVSAAIPTWRSCTATSWPDRHCTAAEH